MPHPNCDPTALSKLFGYRCLPYYLASIVYLTFPSDTYAAHKQYTEGYLLLSTYYFLGVIYFLWHVHGLVCNFIPLFYLLLGTLNI